MDKTYMTKDELRRFRTFLLKTAELSDDVVENMSQREISALYERLLETLAIAIGPDGWRDAEPTLVSIKIPKELSEQIKAVADCGRMTQAEIESAFINECVQAGLGTIFREYIKKWQEWEEGKDGTERG